MTGYGAFKFRSKLFGLGVTVRVRGYRKMENEWKSNECVPLLL